MFYKVVWQRMPGAVGFLTATSLQIYQATYLKRGGVVNNRIKTGLLLSLSGNRGAARSMAVIYRDY